MDFNAAIFDLDGTILDSMDVWEHIDIQFLKKRNLPVPENYVTEICARSFEEAAQYTMLDYYGCGRNLDGLFVSTDIVCEWINLFSIYFSFYSITDLRCLLNNNTYYNFCYLSKNSMQKFVGGTDQNGRLILKCPSVVTFHPDFQ